MIITLLGHSGCGKSHFARRLAAELGFKNICCDDLIEQKLAPELERQGLSTIAGVSKWMGQPYEPHSQERQEKYLAAEAEVIDEIVASLPEDGWGAPDNIVIDTSGSVIYTGEKRLLSLKQRSRIIYLAVPESEYQFMFEQYFADPKPVIWAGGFRLISGETNEQALERSYPELITTRSKLYAEYADVTLVINRENRDRFSVKRLLQLAGAR